MVAVTVAMVDVKNKWRDIDVPMLIAVGGGVVYRLKKLKKKLEDASLTTSVLSLGEYSS